MSDLTVLLVVEINSLDEEETKLAFNVFISFTY